MTDIVLPRRGIGRVLAARIVVRSTRMPSSQVRTKSGERHCGYLEGASRGGIGHVDAVHTARVSAGCSASFDVALRINTRVTPGQPALGVAFESPELTVEGNSPGRESLPVNPRSPMRCTWIRLVVPLVFGGEPATMTPRSPR